MNVNYDFIGGCEPNGGEYGVYVNTWKDDGSQGKTAFIPLAKMCDFYRAEEAARESKRLDEERQLKFAGLRKAAEGAKFIDAIREVRTLTGCGLVEAKNIVEILMRR